MLWLREQGHPVDGELSELAINSFCENNLSAERSEVGPYQCHRHDDLRIYQGDFFAAPELGQRYRLVYDRAALIALPGAMRRQYAALMSRLVEAGGRCCW
jgi:thiopurine S-methyltransferase